MTTYLITGANRGLGLEIVRQISEAPGHGIIACCRAPERAEALLGLAEAYDGLEIERLDMGDLASIDALGVRLGDKPIDVLINNAGIFGKNPPATTGFQDQMFGNSDFDADWIAPFRINVVGPMKLTETLIDNVAASDEKKVVVITSIVGSIEYAGGHMFGYAASKAAANMTAKNLALAVRDRGVIVNPIHPGYAKTDMGGEAAHIDPAEGVKGVLKRIGGMTMATTGEFFSYDGSNLPW